MSYFHTPQNHGHRLFQNLDITLIRPSPASDAAAAAATVWHAVILFRNMPILQSTLEKITFPSSVQLVDGNMCGDGTYKLKISADGLSLYFKLSESVRNLWDVVGVPVKRKREEEPVVETNVKVKKRKVSDTEWLKDEMDKERARLNEMPKVKPPETQIDKFVIHKMLKENNGSVSGVFHWLTVNDNWTYKKKTI